MELAVVAGIVARGQGLGRELGFPTANIAPDGGLYPDIQGVYRVEISWENMKYAAVCNIGVRPTLGANGVRVMEVHIPGFSADLYGRRVQVKFQEKIREERKFPSLDALKEQIQKDVESLGRGPL